MSTHLVLQKEDGFGMAWNIQGTSAQMDTNSKKEISLIGTPTALLPRSGIRQKLKNAFVSTFCLF